MENAATYIEEIEATPSLLERALRLAGLVTRVFRDAGWELVVVGGSAVEFYTEGAYMSGDIDFCRRTAAPIPLRTAQELMGSLGATGGLRSWKVAGLYVDLLGFLENESVAPYRTVATPYGPIGIVPAELAIVERTLAANYPAPDEDAANVARKLLAVCLSGATPVDWPEVERLAALPAFDVAAELRALKEEVSREIGLGN